MTVVIGTAGHIDHGKTALLRALTGIDADRLPEERRRGMTIEVGYAHLRLPDGTELDFVDVPGHDRLVGNMLVGAGEIQAALLVVAADDGPRAQTIEHLRLLDGLDIHDGIVALTKVDLVDQARMVEVTELIRAILAGTTLAGAPIVPVSSITGSGLPQLSAELVGLRDRVLARRPPASPDEPVRLAIDRTFVVKGRGTVVTGSLQGGRLKRGATLRLVPGDRAVRARELQVHGAAVDAVEGGGRVAINVAGLDVGDLPRGAVLTSDPQLRASPALIALLRPVMGRVAGQGWPPAAGATFRLHLGTEQVEARLGRVRLDRIVLPDGRTVGRLRLSAPIALAAGDRFVLRRHGPDPLPIGGVILDPDPPIGPSRRRASSDAVAGLASTSPADRARALVLLHGVLDPGHLPAGIAGDRTGGMPVAGFIVAESIIQNLEAEALTAVESPAQPGSAGQGRSRAELRTLLVRSLRRVATVAPRPAGAIVDGLLDRLEASGRLDRHGDRLHPPGRTAGLPAAVLLAMDRLEQTLATATPPGLADALRSSACPPEGLRALDQAGRIVRVGDDLAYAASSYWALARTALDMARGGVLTPAALRDSTGTSRKYVLAILEDLDRRGILLRTAAGHVPGPRAAQAARS